MYQSNIRDTSCNMKISIVLISFALFVAIHAAMSEVQDESLIPDHYEIESVDHQSGTLLVRTRRAPPCGGFFQASTCNLRCLAERKKSKCGGGKCWCQ